MPTTVDPYASIIIPAAAGLLGALVGGAMTFLAQLLQLRHERKLESEKQAFAKGSAADSRRTEFRLKRWAVEAEALSDIKSHVKFILDRIRAPLDDAATADLYSRLAEVSSLSSRVTRHIVLMSNIYAFTRDAKLLASAARTNNMQILGGPTFASIHSFGEDILKESDRLILEQPDLSSVDRLKRAVAYITNDLRSRKTFLPEDDVVRSRLVGYFAVLRDEETIELAFGKGGLPEKIESFRVHAGKVFDECDLTTTGGVPITEYEESLGLMQHEASAIFRLLG